MSTNSTKTIKGRISNKHGTEEYWLLSVYKSLDDLSDTNKHDNPFIPLPGELIIYDPVSIDEAPKFKFGDPENREGGRRNVVDLPFASGVNFTTDESLTFKDGVLSVNVASAAEQDNTLPISSAAVATTVGNIEILLKTI